MKTSATTNVPSAFLASAAAVAVLAVLNEHDPIIHVVTRKSSGADGALSFPPLSPPNRTGPASSIEPAYRRWVSGFWKSSGFYINFKPVKTLSLTAASWTVSGRPPHASLEECLPILTHRQARTAADLSVLYCG